MIKNWNQYNEQARVDEIIKFIDYSITESFSASDLWFKTLNKLKGLSKESQKKILQYAVASLLTVISIQNVVKLLNQDNTIKMVGVEVVADTLKKTIPEFKNGFDYTLSSKGWEHIKSEEKLRLKAYSIGDGMITIGYGHAERISESKYKVGDVITEEKANELLKEDLKVAADGVRRMFTQWSDQAVIIPISQSMFDALVSVAFNTGIVGLRKSDAIRDLKKGDYAKSGEKIATLNISKKFPGLATRREKESKMFLSSIPKTKKDITV